MKIKLDVFGGETVQKAALSALVSGYDAILFNDRLYKVRVDIDELLPGVNIAEVIKLCRNGVKAIEV